MPREAWWGRVPAGSGWVRSSRAGGLGSQAALSSRSPGARQPVRAGRALWGLLGLG